MDFLTGQVLVKMKEGGSAVFQIDKVAAPFMGALRRRLKPAATSLQLRATGSHSYSKNQKALSVLG